jgi:hypothetical protein
MATKKKTTKKTAKKVAVKMKTNSDVLWEKIKGLDLNLFGLPGQTLEKNAERFEIDPDAVYMVIKTGAVLPALEEALQRVDPGRGKRFDLNQVDRYTVLKTVHNF